MTFFSFGTGSLDPFSQISQSCSQPLNTKPGYLQQESESNSEITGFRSHLYDSIKQTLQWPTTKTCFFAGPRKSLALFVFSWCHDLFSSHLRAGSIVAKKGSPLLGPFWISGYPHYFGELKSHFKSLLEWETPSWKSSASWLTFLKFSQKAW